MERIKYLGGKKKYERIEKEEEWEVMMIVGWKTFIKICTVHYLTRNHWRILCPYLTHSLIHSLIHSLSLSLQISSIQEWWIQIKATWVDIIQMYFFTVFDTFFYWYFWIQSVRRWILSSYGSFDLQSRNHHHCHCSLTSIV